MEFQQKNDEYYKEQVDDAIKHLLKDKPYPYILPLAENAMDHTDVSAAIHSLLTNNHTMGKTVIEFEKQFAAKVGSKHAVMVNSGSSANLLAAAAIINQHRKAGFLKAGDKILVPALCWSTSVWPFIQLGLEVVFLDVDPSTLNLSLDDLKKKCTPDVKAICFVHILGNCCDMSEALSFVRGKGLVVIEDTCESLGTTYDGKMLGTLGDFGSYSFYYSHHITTIEGGMVVCQTDEDYELLILLRAHGWTRNLS
jgi:CDP-6-deoxy-D-xylo-4-hexulose-3-dehydrase